MRKKGQQSCCPGLQKSRLKLLRELFRRVPWQTAFEAVGVHKCCPVCEICLLEEAQEQAICKSNKQDTRPAWLKRGKQFYNLESKVRLHRSITELWFLYAGKTQARVPLELKTASVVLGNKKGFLKYDNCRRRSKENIGLRVAEDSHLTNRNEEKEESFHAGFFFPLVFHNTDISWAAQTPDYKYPKCGSNDISFVGTETVRNQLYQLNGIKSMELDGTYPSVLKEPADIRAGIILIIYQRLW